MSHRGPFSPPSKLSSEKKSFLLNLTCKTPYTHRLLRTPPIHIARFSGVR